MIGEMGMNRSTYFNYIEKKINFLSFRISKRGKLNLLEFNIHSEIFFANMFNIIFKWQLTDINKIKRNTEGIDLVDVNNKLIVQVSATCTKQKIEDSLKKKILKKYPDFRFKFIAISGDANKLRDKNFNTPYGVIFNPKEDIYDVDSILKHVLYMEIDEQRDLYDFIEKELGNELDIVKIDSNLTTIINILSKEDLTIANKHPERDPFGIDKKIDFNDLNSVRLTIDEFKVYSVKLDEKYKEFDKQGANKSLSILSKIKQEYVKLSKNVSDAHDLFFLIIENIIEIVKGSKNYTEIPYEELEMCVSIIVVDAFMRCKIFKKPGGVIGHVTSR